MRFLLKKEWDISHSVRDRIPQSKITLFIEEIYNKISKIIEIYGFNHEIYGISMTLFHYYTYSKSIRDIDPTEISVTCVYLACKIQFVYLPMDRIMEMYNNLKKITGDTSKKTPDFIKYEIEIYSFLGYDLDIETPYSWFYKFIITSYGKKLNEKTVKSFCFNIINDTYRKPWCLYYHPKVWMWSALIFTVKFWDIESSLDINLVLKDENLEEIAECMGKIYNIFDDGGWNTNKTTIESTSSNSWSNVTKAGTPNNMNGGKK